MSNFDVSNSEYHITEMYAVQSVVVSRTEVWGTREMFKTFVYTVYIRGFFAKQNKITIKMTTFLREEDDKWSSKMSKKKCHY